MKANRTLQVDADHLVYESVKPGAGGSVSLMLTPLELIERLAALVRSRRAEQGPHLWGCDPAAGCRRPVSPRRSMRVLNCYHGCRGHVAGRHRHAGIATATTECRRGFHASAACSSRITTAHAAVRLRNTCGSRVGSFILWPDLEVCL